MIEPRPPRAEPDDDRLVLHSSWRGMVVAYLSPLLLVALGSLVIASRGWHVVPAAIAGTGLLVELAVLLDYPRRAVFRSDGIDRVSALRHQHLPWQQVRSIERARTPTVRRLIDSTEKGPGPTRGLVAARGRRHIMLVDQCESLGEYESVFRAVRAWAPDLQFAAPPPSDRVPPTWMYRRRSAR